jgi:dTDP-4-amino-4,6-dideoxygalactose transaminase
MFPCLANQEAYKLFGFGSGDNYIISNDMEKKGFYVGVHQYLTKEQLEYLVKGLNEEL